MTKRRILALTLGAVATVAIAAVSPASAAVPSDYSLFGAATYATPGNPGRAVQLVSDGTSGTYSGVDFGVSPALTINTLNTLSTDYNFTSGTCGLGSPRFGISLAGYTGTIFVYIGPPPNYAGCAPGWTNPGNLLTATSFVDTSQLPNGNFYNTWAHAQMLYSGSQVTDIFLVSDSGAGPSYTQTVLIDNTNVNTTIYTYEATTPLSGNLCNGTYTGTFNGNITVSSGQICNLTGGASVTGNIQLQQGGTLILDSAHVGGNVQVNGGGTFSIGPATIGGDLQVQNIPAGSAQNQICGSTVKGNLQFQNNGSPVLIGAAPSCAGNKIGGNLTVQNNTAEVSVVGNTVGNNLTVQNNTKATIVDTNTVGGNLQDQGNTALTQVYTNIVTHNLQCQSNSPAPVGGGNTAASKQGQCAAF